MNTNNDLSDFGETKLIEIIENLIFKKTGKKLIRDDSFLFNLKNEKSEDILVLNSDMFVSTTDAPPQMNHYQIGRKSVIMNASDLIVKGVKPRGFIVSLGLPKEMKHGEFKALIEGIIDYCVKLNLDYIGGDLNETKELIVNPTIFGFERASNIIYRKGVKTGDFLVANGKFGLTGVGFDILLKRKGNLKDFPSYKRSIMSVLEPNDLGREALILAEKRLAIAGIDSSDGLARSLFELMVSNQGIGFEIDFNDDLIDTEAKIYHDQFKVSLENIIFNAGEEFIHLFTIAPENYETAEKFIQENQGKLFKIGKVISEEKILILKEGKKYELKTRGFEHFK